MTAWVDPQPANGRRAMRSRAMRIGRAASMCLYVIVFLCAGAVRVAPAQVASRTGAVKEYQLKSVFLFNFAQFVDWPADAFADAQAPLVIGVLGDDPFGPFLDETVRGEHVNGRSLVVRRYRRLEDVKNCHILFVSRSESEQLPAILAGLKGRSILTVGDMPDFAVNGGMIRFVNEKNRIRLSINLDAAKSANVTISSKLLRPAEIVTTTKE